jgi:hypothetical protein
MSSYLNKNGDCEDREEEEEANFRIGAGALISPVAVFSKKSATFDFFIFIWVVIPSHNSPLLKLKTILTFTSVSVSEPGIIKMTLPLTPPSPLR